MSLAADAKVRELTAKVLSLETRLALLERTVVGLTQAQPGAQIPRRVLGVAQSKSPI